jgi:hypothetical protein
MSEQVIIDRRFRGPPESGHGGYVCGVVAGLVGGTAEVTLRRPPPLDRPLEVVRLDGGAVALRDGETVIAEGAPASLDIDVPEPVSFSEAEAASESYFGFERPFSPVCFGCGPKRAEGDGLRIFPGRFKGRDVVAAPWTPDASLAGEDGTVRPEFVWAALDCPGAWAPFVDLTEVRLSMLGRLAARMVAPVRTGERCVVTGWPLGEDGRKLYSGTALFSADGELRAVARATWVRVRMT